MRFADVKFFRRGTIHSLEDYSRFMVKELGRHITTSHVLTAQWDGYILNESAWKDEWLDYDYIGAVWHDGVVGNGGFSLRSKRLLDALGDPAFAAPFYPEDERICRDWREQLEHDYKIRFAPPEVASEFSIEGGRYTGQFGFHSFVTQFPRKMGRPLIFTHSGDHGDIIYSLAAVRALGGGVFYIAPKIWELRQQPTIEHSKNILSLMNGQKYIWGASFSDAKLNHCDYDLNRFREFYANKTPGENKSLFRMAQQVCGTDWPEDKPWLDVDFKVQIPGRPIVISRSTRYLNLLFPWKSLVKKHGQQMIFIGTEREHHEFVSQFGLVPRLETPTLLDVARVVAGSKVFIGNQNCCMAVALGLGVNVIQESWGGPKISLGDLDARWNGNGDPNCMLNRGNAIYVLDGVVKIPHQWLK